MLIVSALLAVMAVWAQSEKQDIQIDKLPKFTQSILQNYFPDMQVTSACKQKSKVKNSFEVTLDGGVDLEFDKDGQWTMVDCHDKAVPERMVPGLVKNYLYQNHPDVAVVKMLKDKKGNYVITLADGTELNFDNQFRVKK